MTTTTATDARTYNRDHELHGMSVYDPETLEFHAMNIIVFESGSVTMAGKGAVTGETLVSHGDAADVLSQVEDAGYETMACRDFIEQTHELREAVEDGEIQL